MSFVENPIALRVREEYEKGKRSEQNAAPDPAFGSLFDAASSFIASPTTYEGPPAEGFRPNADVMSCLDTIDRRIAVDPKKKSTVPGTYVVNKVILPLSSMITLSREQPIPNGDRKVRVAKVDYTIDNGRKYNVRTFSFELKSTGEFVFSRWFQPSYAQDAQLQDRLVYDKSQPDFKKVAPAFGAMQHLLAIYFPDLIQITPVP